MDPVEKSDQKGLFTWDCSGTGSEGIQMNPKLDRFQTVPCKQKPIQSGSVRNSSGPVPCKDSVNMPDVVLLCFRHSQLFLSLHQHNSQQKAHRRKNRKRMTNSSIFLILLITLMFTITTIAMLDVLESLTFS